MEIKRDAYLQQLIERKDMGRFLPSAMPGVHTFKYKQSSLTSQ